MATPTINDISDLARILEEHPEWAETLRSLVLTREVLELPEKVAQQAVHLEQLTEQVAQQAVHLNRLTERVDQLTERVDRLTEQVAQLTVRVDQLTRDVAQLTVRMDQLTERVDQLTVRMDQLTERVDRLTEQVAQLTERVDQLTQDLAQLTARVDQLTARVDQLTKELRDFVQETREHNRRVDERLGRLEAWAERLDRQMGRFLGIVLEHRLQGSIAPLIAERFNLRRPVIVKSWVAQLEQGLYDALEAAEDSGRITTRQSFLAQQTDFILRGQRKDTRAGVYVAVEASRTVNERDITRARERADVLATATGTEALAVVVGNFVAEPQERQAADWAVAIIQVAEPEEELAAGPEGV